VADIVNIMDFAADDVVPVFYVGPENKFTCAPDIPLGIAQQIASFKNLSKDMQETGNLDVLLTLFDELLEEEETGSASRFRELVKKKQIGIRRIMKIIPWILEEYGLGHPTQPSSPSSTGSSDGETGRTSTGGAFPAALSLGGSPSEPRST